MKRFLLVLICLIYFFPHQIASAQTPLPSPGYQKARVEAILREGSRNIGGTQNKFQQLKVVILDGPEKGKSVTVENGGSFTLLDSQKVKPGDTIVLSSLKTGRQTTYAVADKYRLTPLLLLIAGFFLFTFLISGKKGVGATLGLLFSLGVILWYIVPQIIGGANPLTTSIIGSLFIMLVSIYLAHGFSKPITIAVAATFISLILTGILAIVCVNIARLTGLGSEDAYTLLFGFKNTLNLQGLLLGSIIIGALGVLDDTTTTQAATVFALSDENPEQDMLTLIKKSFAIGKEHIASLINTLVLAYAGASIGVFIFLSLNLSQKSQPLWVMLNSEIIAEEIVRTLAGSMGLILAVPITTVLAAFFAKNSIKIN